MYSCNYLFGLFVFPAGAPDLPLVGLTGLLLGPLLLFQSVEAVAGLKEEDAAFDGRSDFPALLEAGFAAEDLPLDGPDGLGLAALPGVTFTSSETSFAFLTILLGVTSFAEELDLATKL